MFDLSLPNSLVDWIDLTDNKFLQKPELKVKIVLADNPTLSKLANNYQKEFSEFYQKYELPFKTNRTYDALHTLHYELKGKDNKRIYVSFGLVCGKIGNQEYKNFLFNVFIFGGRFNDQIMVAKSGKAWHSMNAGKCSTALILSNFT